ncbi:hypothetical protein KQX54_020504 [Cotesia glomerata]|uniref:Uncharacterized protein n=1 Tax=Cotesia glomerata TaxID=32391 RepID=A0AAV7J6A8_COTGL|nr:hypothetical protein KQX54_020504 [Cotesia glomerata]
MLGAWLEVEFDPYGWHSTSPKDITVYGCVVYWKIPKYPYSIVMGVSVGSTIAKSRFPSIYVCGSVLSTVRRCKQENSWCCKERSTYVERIQEEKIQYMQTQGKRSSLYGWIAILRIDAIMTSSEHENDTPAAAG